MTQLGPKDNDGITPESLAEPLIAFLERAAEAFNDDLVRAADHLRYAAEPASTLQGSSAGWELWTSDEGRRLLELLLKDPRLALWFGGKSLRTLELRSIVASVIRAWASSGLDARRYVWRHAGTILQSIREETWSCWGIGFAYGIRVSRRVELPGGLAIDPHVKDILNNVRASGAIAELALLKIHKGYSCLFLQGSSVSRDEMGSIAATTAAVWRHVAFERLRTAIWLVSGGLPVVGDVFVTEVSDYPVTPFQHFPASLQTYPLEPTTVLGDPELAALREAILRLEAVWDGTIHDADSETDLQFRLALSHAEAALRTADSLLAALLAYVAIEGIVLSADDHLSWLTPWVAWLVGHDSDDRRAVRSFMDAFGRLRGDVGHGNPPRLDTLSRLVGRRVTSEEVDVYFSWSGREAGGVIEQRCRNLLRKVILAFMNLAIEVAPDGTVSMGLTRIQIVKMLKAAATRGADARNAARRLEANARTLPGRWG